MIEGHKDSGAGKVDEGGEGLLDSRRKRFKKKKDGRYRNQRRSKLLDIGKVIVTTPITAPNRKYIISYHITVIDSSVLSVLF